MTASMTWMMPFEVSMSVWTTVAPLTMTVSPSTVMSTSDPCAVVAESSVTVPQALPEDAELRVTDEDQPVATVGWPVASIALAGPGEYRVASSASAITSN